MAKETGNSKKGGRRGFKQLLPLLIPLAFLVAGPVLLWNEAEPVEALQNWVFDTYQRLQPRVYEDAGVRILDIDDESLTKLGQWPWPRTVLADIVNKLGELGTASIAFDSIFPEPDRTSPKQIAPLWSHGRRAAEAEKLFSRFPDHDQVFAKALSASHAVLSSALIDTKNDTSPAVKASFIVKGDNPVSFLDRFPGAVANRPELEEAAPGNGTFTYAPERDGTIRRAPLVLRLRDQLIPTLATEALRVAQEDGTIKIKSSPQGIVSVRVGKLNIPTDPKGRLWLHYTRQVPGRTIPIWRIFDKDFDKKSLAGSIAFIGTSAAGLKDQRATPLYSILPGVEIHAQFAEQMLMQDFLARPDWALQAEAAYMVVFGIALMVLLQRRGAVWGAGLTFLGVASAVALAWWAYTRKKWLLDPMVPSLTGLLIYLSFSVTNYLQGERERREIRNAFRFYLSPELVERLATHPENLKLGGEMRKMTFHFCDIQGFTSISEFYDPYALIHFLNGFLSPLTETILKHHGTIDKYIGDCIMAFWNAPIDDPHHARNACLAVIEMHERLKAVNEERRAEAEAEGKGYTPIMIRTGLNSGNCIVGNMGSHQRFSYSVLGDDVNLASRLEGANKFFGTFKMASEATVAEARDAVEVRPLGLLRVVGKVVPVNVFELLARKGELSEDWRKALPVYDRGLKEYYAREFEQAAGSFEEVLAVFPNDGPSAFYLKSAAGFIQNPPPESWDGVVHLTEKH